MKKPILPDDMELFGFAESLLHEWRERLGLTCWTISVEVTAARSMEFRGEIFCNVYDRTAHVKLMHPKRYDYAKKATACDDNRPWFRIFEWVLVHELCHAVLYPMTRHYAKDSPLEVCEEQAINDLAYAMLALKYPGQNVPRDTEWNLWLPTEDRGQGIDQRGYPLYRPHNLPTGETAATVPLPSRYPLGPTDDPCLAFVPRRDWPRWKGAR